MTAETQTITQATEAKNDPRGWGGTALLAALALILAALFVFPGFVAVGLSKTMGVVFVEIFPGDEWSIGGPIIGTVGGLSHPSPMVMRAKTLFAEAVLYPAHQVMTRSSKVCGFYEWQFHLAGGLAVVIFV